MTRGPQYRRLLSWPYRVPHCARPCAWRSCPGITCSKHHLPWGLSSSGFATAEESVYPVPLCKEVAAAFQEIFQQSQQHAGLDYHQLRASTGLQPKASKTVPVVSEHKCLVTWSGPEHLCRMPCRRMERLAHPLPIPTLCQCSLDALPAGAQLLHMHTSVKQGDGSSSCVSVWGIPYNPREFIQAALKSVHPAVAAAKVPEPLLSAIRESKKCNPEILAKTRTDTLKQWAMRAKALESEEERFKSGLHPDVAKILAPKRLLLWKELMARYSYPDTGVFDLITSGVSLTGEVENSRLFNSVNKPATLSVQQLREEADNVTDETLAQVRPQSPEIDQTVLRKTLQEVENGWLTGPIPRHLVPPGSVVCRRFGLCQGEKTRLIDDMRPVNQTVSTFESPRPHTVDVLAAMGRELMSACPGVPIQGKAFDLTAAYRQLPLRPDAAWVSFISIWDCERKEPALFRLKALPFGASKSVYSFLRTSHSLWWLACKALSIVWTLYYDDFVCMSSKALASHTDNCVRAFFFLLGWKFSSSGDKRMDFAEVFTALGVTIHLADCLDGRLTICNTAKRTRELVETIGSVLQGGVVSKALALKLRGRMQFAEGQLFGRAGRLCLRAVSDRAYTSLGARISSQCRRSLVRFAAMLQESTPRTVRVEKGLPWHVYTDASYNAESSEWPCGVGGVLLNPAGRLLAAFSACLPKWFRALLGEGSKETIICFSWTITAQEMWPFPALPGQQLLIGCSTCYFQMNALPKYSHGTKGCLPHPTLQTILHGSWCQQWSCSVQKSGARTFRASSLVLSLRSFLTTPA